jgi:hypothetical protein
VNRIDRYCVSGAGHHDREVGGGGNPTSNPGSERPQWPTCH